MACSKIVKILEKIIDDFFSFFKTYYKEDI